MATTSRRAGEPPDLGSQDLPRRWQQEEIGAGQTTGAQRALPPCRLPAAHQSLPSLPAPWLSSQLGLGGLACSRPRVDLAEPIELLVCDGAVGVQTHDRDYSRAGPGSARRRYSSASRSCCESRKLRSLASASPRSGERSREGRTPGRPLEGARSRLEPEPELDDLRSRRSGRRAAARPASALAPLAGRGRGSIAAWSSMSSRAANRRPRRPASRGSPAPGSRG